MSRQLPCWKAHPVQVGAPAYLYPWLTDRHSLTARIVARCQSFQLRVLHEMCALPGIDEGLLIGLPPGRYAWVREVLLIADDVPVVFAHSVLAPRDLTGAWHMARAIGSRPLGAALFADPRIRREPLSAARLAPAHALHRHTRAALTAWTTLTLSTLMLLQSPPALQTLWARRSRFCRLGRPLLVTEVFLPGIAAL